MPDAAKKLGAVAREVPLVSISGVIENFAEAR
jgi:hypothetical protein